MLRRRRRAAAVLASILVLVVAVFVFVLKSCSVKKNGGEGDMSNAGQTASQMTPNGKGGTGTVIQGTSNTAPDVAGTAQNTQSETANFPQESSSQGGGSNTDDGSFTTAKGFKGETKNGVTYIDGLLVVNKTYALPSSFVPQNPEVPVTSEWSTTSLDKETMAAWRNLQKEAASKGLNIYIASGYRSYNTQNGLYNRYVAQDGKAKADTYSARAGHSEHQSGLCFDLNSIDDSFQYTDEGKWVNENAYRYGFIIRYPEGKENETGYQYESWHLRYVGVDLAAKLYNNGNWITLEDYFGITSTYAEP